MRGVTVVKFGGELIEDAASRAAVARAIVRRAADGPVVVVHGGGRAIDAELRARGISPRFADGLRVTDAATLDVVVGVLAGRANTALVAALGAEGARAVGLTGADAAIAPAVRAGTLRTAAGEDVDLGLVGEPAGSDVRLLHDLLVLGYIPVVCSIGADGSGSLLNVNADTLAGHLAGALRADRLIVAGTTAGVLDAAGRTIARLTAPEIDAMAASGAAHSGMVAKLVACRRALADGVAEVSIVGGGADPLAAPGTRIVHAADAAPSREELRV